MGLSDSVALLEARRSYAQPTRDPLIQEAWAAITSGKAEGSERIFRNLNRDYATEQTAEGLRVLSRKMNGF